MPRRISHPPPRPVATPARHPDNEGVGSCPQSPTSAFRSALRIRPAMIVTIDGPAGAGKSSAARRLARRLGFRFLDTGAMYRAVALAGNRRGVDWGDARRAGRRRRRARPSKSPTTASS